MATPEGAPWRTVVLEVSEELKGLEAPLKALIAEAERRLVDGKAGRRVEYELFE